MTITNSELKQDIERKIIKYLLNDKIYLALSDSSLASKFFSDEYKSVYKFLIYYYRHHSDVLSSSTAELLFNSNQYNFFTANDLSIIQSITNDDLIDIDLTEASFNTTVDILKTQYAKSELFQVAEHIIDENSNSLSAADVKKLSDHIINEVTQLANNDNIVRKSESLSESADDLLSSYNYIKDNPNSIEYIPSGFDAIDKIEGGFRRTELIYVIGRKGTGKSILLLNLAYNACKVGFNILLFSLEISSEDYERRLAACACSLPSNGLKRGTLVEADYKRFEQYVYNLKQKKTIDGKDMGEFVIIDVPNQCTPSFIESQLLLEQRKRGIKFDIVVVDYAGLMQSDQNLPEKRHQQGAIALSFKRLARKYNLAVYSAAQMSRQGRNDLNQKGGHADSAHIAESDQVADHIDWGISIRINDPESKYGMLESFKTRDAAPFSIPYFKNYSMMQMLPVDNSSDVSDPQGLNWSQALI